MKESRYSKIDQLNVYNNSGEVIPPFACMQLDYQFESGKSACEQDGTDLVFWVKKPDAEGAADTAKLVFNGPLSIGVEGGGNATFCPIIQTLWDGDFPSPGSVAGAVDGQWYLDSTGAGFKVKSVDSSGAYPDGPTVFVERYDQPTTGTVQGTISAMSPTGVATLLVVASTDSSLIGNVVSVIDLSGCIFDEADIDLLEVWIWAEWTSYLDETLNVVWGWVAYNRCCI